MSGSEGAAGITAAETAALLELLHAGWAVTFEPCAAAGPSGTRVVARRSDVLVSSDRCDQQRIDHTLLADRPTAGQAVNAAAKEAKKCVLMV